ASRTAAPRDAFSGASVRIGAALLRQSSRLDGDRLDHQRATGRQESVAGAILSLEFVNDRFRCAGRLGGELERTVGAGVLQRPAAFRRDAGGLDALAQQVIAGCGL